MNGLNILHKFFALAVTLLFAVNQAMFEQQHIGETLPERRVKNEVVTRGINAPVIVRLHDKSTLEGCISRITDDSFTVTNPETGEAATIEYNAVARVYLMDAATELVVALVETASVGESILKAIF